MLLLAADYDAIITAVASPLHTLAVHNIDCQQGAGGYVIGDIERAT